MVHSWTHHHHLVGYPDFVLLIDFNISYKDIMKKIHVYVAGPISKGNMLLNTRNGILKSDQLMRYGFVPFVPFLTSFWETVSPKEYEEWLAYDFAWILKCDALFRMDGISPGADREVAHARANGIPVFFDIEDLKNAFPFASSCCGKSTDMYCTSVRDGQWTEQEKATLRE